MTRPAVSVVVPFYGGAEDAAAAVRALSRLELRAGDELLVADNTPGGVDVAPLRRVPAGEVQSSYFARNAGARAARHDWLLFLDADCVPAPDLLDRYFAAPLPASWGAVAGGVEAGAGGGGLLARYAAARGHLDPAVGLAHPFRPMAVTANLLVRRAAYEAAGGFLEGVRSGGDTEFSWRLQDAGWELGLRAGASVSHAPRERLRGLLRQLARYGASRAWLNRRYPGSSPRPRPVREVVRCTGGAVVSLARGRFEQAAFFAIDVLAALADAAGYASPNVSAGSVAPPAADVVIVTDRFPELSETFVASEARALTRTGLRVRIVAGARGTRPEPSLARGLHVTWLEDEGIAPRLLAAAGLVLTAPGGVARDLWDRRRWRREEAVRPLRGLALTVRALRAEPDAVLHVHFAAGAALDALRIARLLGGRPWSVTAHAYEIFREPMNLVEKLETADLVTSGCAYNVEHLRAAAPRARVEEIVMGVDPERFRRTAPYPGGRTVVAVGRLVEKKGFGDLVDAVALARDAVERVVVAGAGPLRDALAARVAGHGLDGVVELAGALAPDRIRSLLEEADVLAMPCVVAADGDRDSMPVVVKEALAMEVPVVASDEVGLPELVREPWGRLAPPHDPAALAEALRDVLGRPAGERAEMGRAGRAFVVEHGSVDREAQKLADLLREVKRARLRADKP